jgi:hypothetical protein
MLTVASLRILVALAFPLWAVCMSAQADDGMAAAVASWKEADQRIETFAQTTFHTLRAANIRVAPRLDAKVLGWIPLGSEFHVYGRVTSHDWYAVSQDGRLGFVSGNLVAPAGTTRPLVWPRNATPAVAAAPLAQVLAAPVTPVREAAVAPIIPRVEAESCVLVFSDK